MVRSLTLFGAHKAGVAAIETVFPNIKDEQGLTGYLDRARRDGFTAMMAIHPAQVAAINAAFTPSEEELAHAREIVALFAADPTLGVVQLHGKMVDRPHLRLAEALIARAG
jgi:citrate lyase subunit beta/citryl-CoA lyase